MMSSANIFIIIILFILLIIKFKKSEVTRDRTRGPLPHKPDTYLLGYFIAYSLAGFSTVSRRQRASHALHSLISLSLSTSTPLTGPNLEILHPFLIHTMLKQKSGRLLKLRTRFSPSNILNDSQ